MENENLIKKINELSGTMEKMYKEHNFQITNLNNMIVSLARESNIDPVSFAKKFKEEDFNAKYAGSFNNELDKTGNS
jgi:hypothetical protein